MCKERTRELVTSCGVYGGGARSVAGEIWRTEGKRAAKRGKERERRNRPREENEKPEGLTRCQRYDDLRVSFGKACSGVYYYLFDDQRRMWATSPRCAPSPLISDNPLGTKKARACTHVRRTHARETTRRIRPFTADDEEEDVPKSRPTSTSFFIIFTVDEWRFHFLRHPPTRDVKQPRCPEPRVDNVADEYLHSGRTCGEIKEGAMLSLRWKINDEIFAKPQEFFFLFFFFQEFV